MDIKKELNSLSEVVKGLTGESEKFEKKLDEQVEKISLEHLFQTEERTYDPKEGGELISELPSRLVSASSSLLQVQDLVREDVNNIVSKRLRGAYNFSQENLDRNKERELSIELRKITHEDKKTEQDRAKLIKSVMQQTREALSECEKQIRNGSDEATKSELRESRRGLNSVLDQLSSMTQEQQIDSAISKFGNNVSANKDQISKEYTLRHALLLLKGAKKRAEFKKSLKHEARNKAFAEFSELKELYEETQKAFKNSIVKPLEQASEIVRKIDRSEFNFPKIDPEADGYRKTASKIDNHINSSLWRMNQKRKRAEEECVKIWKDNQREEGVEKLNGSAKEKIGKIEGEIGAIEKRIEERSEFLQMQYILLRNITAEEKKNEVTKIINELEGRQRIDNEDLKKNKKVLEGLQSLTAEKQMDEMVANFNQEFSQKWQSLSDEVLLNVNSVVRQRNQLIMERVKEVKSHPAMNALYGVSTAASVTSLLGGPVSGAASIAGFGIHTGAQGVTHLLGKINSEPKVNRRLVERIQELGLDRQFEAKKVFVASAVESANLNEVNKFFPNLVENYRSRQELLRKGMDSVLKDFMRDSDDFQKVVESISSSPEIGEEDTPKNVEEKYKEYFANIEKNMKEVEENALNKCVNKWQRKFPEILEREQGSGFDQSLEEAIESTKERIKALKEAIDHKNDDLEASLKQQVEILKNLQLMRREEQICQYSEELCANLIEDSYNIQKEVKSSVNKVVEAKKDFYMGKLIEAQEQGLFQQLENVSMAATAASVTLKIGSMGSGLPDGVEEALSTLVEVGGAADTSISALANLATVGVAEQAGQAVFKGSAEAQHDIKKTLEKLRERQKDGKSQEVGGTQQDNEVQGASRESRGFAKRVEEKKQTSIDRRSM